MVLTVSLNLLYCEVSDNDWKCQKPFSTSIKVLSLKTL